MIFGFFFQAEDGIRDIGVTGVQTCALPILVSYWTAYLKANYPAEYMAGLLTSVGDDKDRRPIYLAECRRMGIKVLPPDVNESSWDSPPSRSGERRGGKECRSRWSPYH